MRMILFFDLPQNDSNERKEYRDFRKSLIKQGYIQEQYSVYSKLLGSSSALDAEIRYLEKNKAKAGGNIQVLIITEKEYQNIKYISGEKNPIAIDPAESVFVYC